MNKMFIPKNESKRIRYQCDNCETENEQTIEISRSDYDDVLVNPGRGMGAETLYEAELCTKCPKCDHEIIIKSCIWEYPVGAINLVETRLEGALLIKEESHLDD